MRKNRIHEAVAAIFGGVQGKARRNHQGRRLGLETLEQRQLLAVSPLVGPHLEDGSFVSTSALVADAPQTALSPLVSGGIGGGWSMPQAVVVTPYVYDSWVDTRHGDTAVGAEEIVLAFQPDTSLRSVEYGVKGTAGSIESAVLKADLTDFDGRWGKPDGYFETELAVDDARDGSLVFELGWGIQVPQAGLPLQVELTFDNGAQPGEYTLSEPTMGLSRWGKGVRAMQFGYPNPTITVEGHPSVTLVPSDPQTIAIGEQDIVLATEIVDAHGNSAWIDEELVVRAEGGTAEDFSEIVSALEVCDPNGEVYQATLRETVHDGDIVAGIYDVGFPAYDVETFRIRADLTGQGLSDGDRLQVGIRYDGNPELVGPWHTIEETALQVTELRGPNEDIAVSGERDLVGDRFVIGAEGGDVLVTSVTVSPAVGYPGVAASADLWVDTDGDQVVDTILQRDVLTSLYQFTFDALPGGGYVVPEGSEARFEMRFDVISDYSVEGERIQFTLAQVEAERLDSGASIPEDNISVSNTPQTIWNMKENGECLVTEDTTPLRPRQVLGGELSDTLLRIDVVAFYESVDVTYVGIDVEGEGRSIDRIELWKAGAMAPFASAVRGAAEAGDDFGVHLESQHLVVAENSETTLLLKARVKADTEGGVSGDWFALAVDQVMARGVVSSNTITPEIDEDIVGPTHQVVTAKVASITNANPDPDGTAITTGWHDFGQFKFAAAANVNTANGLDRVAIDALIFNVVATNVELDADFRFYVKGSETAWVNATPIANDGTVLTGTVTGSFLVRVSPLDVAIEQGSDATFVLRANVLDTEIVPGATSSLLVSLEAFNNPVATAWGPSASHIKWRAVDSAMSNLDILWVDYPDTSIRSTAYRNN